MGSLVENKIVMAPCSECGGGNKRHMVYSEKTETWEHEETGARGSANFAIVGCAGCGTTRFRHASHIVDLFGDFAEETITVYPQEAQRPTYSAKFLPFDDIPDKIFRIYNETIQSLNFGAPILTGAGLRAIIEAVCLDRAVAGGTLARRIDDLAAKGLLARSQADALHLGRLLGNAALHEVEAPSKDELYDGMQIVESLIHNIYILPGHAERMKKTREAKASKKSIASSHDHDAESE